MAQVTGVVEKKNVKLMNTSLLIAGEWYSSFKGAGLDNVDEGDTVDFLWNPDKKGGGFKNIVATTVKVLAKGSGAVPSVRAANPISAAPYKKEYSTLGVELGHASNLAMEMCLHTEIEVGTDEFYKAWVHHTDKIFTIMQKIRASKEAVAVSAKVMPPKPEPVTKEDEAALESIF